MPFAPKSPDRALPLDPAGGSALDPRYRSVQSARHLASLSRIPGSALQSIHEEIANRACTVRLVNSNSCERRCDLKASSLTMCPYGCPLSCPPVSWNCQELPLIGRCHLPAPQFATHHCHSLFFVTASRLIYSSNSCGVCDSERTPDKYSN